MFFLNNTISLSQILNSIIVAHTKQLLYMSHTNAVRLVVNIVTLGLLTLHLFGEDLC